MQASNRAEKLLLFALPAIILLAGCGAHFLRAVVLALLVQLVAAWTCLSCILGAVIGHCILSEP